MDNPVDIWIRVLEEKKLEAIHAVNTKMSDFYATVENRVASLDGQPGVWQPYAPNPIAFLHDEITRAKAVYQEPLMDSLTEAFCTFASRQSPAFAKHKGGGPLSIMTPDSLFRTYVPWGRPSRLPTFRGSAEPVKTEVDIAEANFLAHYDAALAAAGTNRQQQQRQNQAVVRTNNQGASTSTGRRSGRPTAAAAAHANYLARNNEIVAVDNRRRRQQFQQRQQGQAVAGINSNNQVASTGRRRGRPTATPVRYAEEASENDEEAAVNQPQVRPKRRRMASPPPAAAPVTTAGTEKKHPCPVNGCGRSFAYVNGLGKHMLTHTGERPHACAVCGRTFALAATRNRHLRTHNRQNTHVCTWPDCTYAAIRSSSVVQHVRSVHFKLPASKTEQARQGITDTREASEYVEKI